MKHLHKASGLIFECGELIDIRERGMRVSKTYDMTVITLWNNNSDKDDFRPPVIIGYYFGDYDAVATDYYIDCWFEKQSTSGIWRKLVGDCASIVSAYYATNCDALDDDDRRKVRTVRDGLNNLLEVYNNEKR